MAFEFVELPKLPIVRIKSGITMLSNIKAKAPMMMICFQFVAGFFFFFLTGVVSFAGDVVDMMN